jgi:membrane fusion protein, multidrug efflux system
MKRTFAPASLLAAAAILMLAVPACKKSPATATGKASNTQTVTVKAMDIVPQSFAEHIRLTGSLASYDDIMVPAEEGGRVLEWTAPKGASVKKGQVIAKMDDAVLHAAFDAANAQYLLAEANYTKQKKVFEEQAISDLQMKSFEYQRDAAKAGADLAKARWDKMQIKSPVDGVLNNRFVDAGEMIGPGMPVAHVVSSGRLKITAGVPERYTGAVKVGEVVRFTVDAFPKEEFAGKIIFVGAAVSRDNRSIPIEIQVTSGVGKLKPDMIASLEIMLAAKPGCIVIPDDYIQQVDKGAHVVYVAVNDVAEERRITMGGTNDGSVLVLSGLKAGEKLITLGFQNVANGQRISVQP